MNVPAESGKYHMVMVAFTVRGGTRADAAQATAAKLAGWGQMQDTPEFDSWQMVNAEDRAAVDDDPIEHLDVGLDAMLNLIEGLRFDLSSARRS